jgi:hypothetical protein
MLRMCVPMNFVWVCVVKLRDGFSREISILYSGGSVDLGGLVVSVLATGPQVRSRPRSMNF